MQYNRAAASEIDITGMGATVYQDPQNTNRKFVRRNVDFTVVDMGELNCDFYGPGEFNESHVGLRRQLSIVGGVGNSPSCEAFLTQISTEIVAGDLIKGSCTFKLVDA
jgi:hypothetical protein